MRLIVAADSRALEALVQDQARDPAVVRKAARIVHDVRHGGDAAIVRWERRLGRRTLAPHLVSSREMKAGWSATPASVRQAITHAIRNVRRMAERQLPRAFSFEVEPGVRLEQRVQPLERVGCYVPGGRYPLPSTVIMTIVPARTAGVPDVVVACPDPSPAVLCAALEAGASSVLRVGGAQAIAALAYGTETIDRVVKLVGPGSAWVAAAQQLVSADVATDFHAGPSEIVVCSDTGRPDWIAADLIAQAEHDPAARAILVTTSRGLARNVSAALAAQTLRRSVAARALQRRGAIVVASSRSEAIDVVNHLAPEHLVCDGTYNANVFRTAGTVFVGRWSAQAAGDYCTGSNHVLPTGRAGRFRGGLSAADFVRVYTVQRVTPRGLRALAPSAIALATEEGLTAHAASIQIRTERRARASRAD